MKLKENISNIQVHEDPNLYISVEAVREITKADDSIDDDMDIIVTEFYLENCKNMHYFNYAFDIEAVTPAKTYTGFIHMKAGAINDLFDQTNKKKTIYSSSKSTDGVSVTNLKNISTGRSYKKSTTIKFKMKCDAAKDGGTGCTILEDPHNYEYTQIKNGKIELDGYVGITEVTLTLDSTGKTVISNLTWKDGNSSSKTKSTLEIKSVNKSTNSTNGSPMKYTFTGLNQNTNYTVNYTINDGIVPVSGSKSIKTKYSKISVIDKSTKAIKIKIEGSGNNSNTKTTYTCGSVKGTVTGLGEQLISGLPYNTIINLSSTSQYDDTLFEIENKTKLFSIECTGHRDHQFSLESDWQAKADGENYDVDPLDNYNIQYSTTTGTMNGKTCNYTGLKSFEEHTMTVSAYDGYNTVSNNYKSKTLYPYVRVFKNGKWHNAMVYIHNGTNWKLAKTMMNNGNGFIETSAE